MSFHTEQTMTMRASVVEDIPDTESQTINIHFHDIPVFRDLMLADPEYSSRCRDEVVFSLGGVCSPE